MFLVLFASRNPLAGCAVRLWRGWCWGRGGVIVPIVEATFVDGEKPITSFRAGSKDELRENFISAMALLDTLGVKPKKGDITYAAGYTVPVFGLDKLLLLNRQELGQNPDGFERAWALLGEV